MMKIKTLNFHKSAIKKACAALVKDGYDRNQAIGALIEFFLADKGNPEFFNTLMKGYLSLLKEDFDQCGKFRPRLTSTKAIMAEIKKVQSDRPVKWKTIRGPGRSPGKAVRV